MRIPSPEFFHFTFKQNEYFISKGKRWKFQFVWKKGKFVAVIKVDEIFREDLPKMEIRGILFRLWAKNFTIAGNTLLPLSKDCLKLHTEGNDYIIIILSYAFSEWKTKINVVFILFILVVSQLKHLKIQFLLLLASQSHLNFASVSKVFVFLDLYDFIEHVCFRGENVHRDNNENGVFAPFSCMFQCHHEHCHSN